MNNLSDFANFGEFFGGLGGAGGGGGRQTEVCATGAKIPRYASVNRYRYPLVFVRGFESILF